MKIKSTLIGLMLTAVFATPVLAQEVGQPTVATAPKLGEVKNDRTSWGFGLGYVFTTIPISESKFTVLMSELHYSVYLTDPNESVRTQATLGLYGFGLILPIPKVSVEMFLGDPTQDIQAKVGVGAFYDITVGGAAGLPIEVGARIKNHVDVSFVAVPAGIDSKRDYLEFIGQRDKAGPKPYVIYPFYGLFLTFNY